ncbi:MAG: ATP-binding protein, partial [Chloroflexia bacterium]|nr:ATP-binding protein [Chloroflexia bacterium]
MLVEFRVTNFRSFKETQIFSLIAGSDRSLPENTIHSEALGKLRLNRSAVVYGANASGKSNLIAALEFVRRFVLNSVTRRTVRETREGESKALVPVVPFLLDQATREAPSEFELVFIQKDVRYQYGFQVDRQRVHKEWLIAFPHGQPQRWFERTLKEDGEYVWTFRSKQFRGEKQLITDVTRADALYLSVGSNFRLDQLIDVSRWFNRLRFYVPPTSLRAGMSITAARASRHPAFHQRVRELLTFADVGIVDFTVEEVVTEISPQRSLFPEDDRSSAQSRRYEVLLAHQGAPFEEPALLPLQEESRGTQQLFELAARLIDALDEGSLLIIDELDSSLHPILTRKLVEMFHDPQINQNNAQLIFNTHDVSLLDRTLFRRDQIWFTEKDRAGATQLYSLLEFSPRKEEALAKNYLQGRYGAIPFIEDLGEWWAADAE